MEREQMISKIRAEVVDNRLSCAKAHALSRELNVSLSELGTLCNELKIRISQCQLGCF